MDKIAPHAIISTHFVKHIHIPGSLLCRDGDEEDILPSFTDENSHVGGLGRGAQSVEHQT